MFRAYPPQRAARNISANTSNPPQGEIPLISVVDGGWVDDLGNQFIDDNGTPIMFTEPP